MQGPEGEDSARQQSDKTEDFENMSLEQMKSLKEQTKQKLTEMVDVKDRLTVHAYVLRLCLANGLHMYHN